MKTNLHCAFTRFAETPVIYVAGPYRAATVRGIVCNIRAAESIALELWGRGFAVICPHMNTALFDGSLPDSVWLRGDLAILARCDAVVVAPGWEASEGVRAELRAAREAGIPVHMTVAEVVEWAAVACAPAKKTGRPRKIT